MKKILICASRVSHILNFHLPYLQYFKSQGYEVHIAVQGSTDDPLIDRCFDLHFTKNPLSPDNIGTIFRLKKIIQNGNYSIIYSNTTLAGVAVRAALMLLSGTKPYYVHICHGYIFSEKNDFTQKMILACERMTKSPVQHLVVMNREDYDLAKKYRLGKILHYISGMGLCPEKFPPVSNSERQRIRQSLGADDHTRILLCIGEFSARKNQKVLIEVFDRLLKNHRDLILVFAGEGGCLEDCRRLAERYELGGKVRFLGYREDINLLCRSADLLLSASKMEGMPFNVMEALYCGLPCVLSDVKGHRDLAEDGGIVLFDKDRPDDIYRQINAVLSSPSVYQKLLSTVGLNEKYLLKNVQPELLPVLDREYSQKERVSV